MFTTKNWISSMQSSTKQIVFTALLLLISIVFFGLSTLDINLQDLLYNTQTHQWLLSKNTEPYHFIFYSGIKKLLILIAIILLIVLLFFRKKPTIKPYTKGLLIVILSAIFVPLITGGIKEYSNMPCPKHEIHYGGKYPRTAVWERYEVPYNTLDTIQCWPAGHASGGFALMSLFFLFKRKRNKVLALIAALMIGWSMGTYKMLIGDHFFSHTFITMLLAWLIILIIEKIVSRFKVSK